MKKALRRLLRRPRLRQNIQLEPHASVQGCRFEGRVRIGYRSYSNDSFFRNVEVGRFCSIGRRCSIGAARHSLDSLTTHSLGQPLDWEIGPDTSIGNDVWIGDGALVMAGVRIGDGAVIGAAAVVTKDVPPYAIAVGVPAKVVRHRFAPDLVERLLAARWWRFGDVAPLAAREAGIAAALDRLEREPPAVLPAAFSPLAEY